MRRGDHLFIGNTRILRVGRFKVGTSFFTGPKDGGDQIFPSFFQRRHPSLTQEFFYVLREGGPDLQGSSFLKTVKKIDDDP